MAEQVSIKGMDKAEVLAALFNASRQHGLGFLDRSGASDLTVEQARADIERCGLHFDYHRGRVLKVRIDGDQFWPGLYDRDNGPGAAARAIESIAVRS